MQILIGSARHDEHNKYSGGAKGDSLQNTTPDYKGEVSQQLFYVHTKGWYVLVPKSVDVALKMAAAMKQACNNKNIGYSQSDRYSILKYGTKATVKCNCDCSSLIRVCVKEATGKDPGDFTTANAVAKLTATGYFKKAVPYTYNVKLYTGSVLCTKTKGHIVAVTSGYPLQTQEHIYFPKYAGTSKSIADALNSLNFDNSRKFRQRIAEVNGIKNYTGTYLQNKQLLSLLMRGKLIMPTD